MTTEQNYIEINRKLWNAKTHVHLNSDFYGMAQFRAGETSLQAIELEQLGDITGKSLLHLQCHFGQDSLSLARLGAKVTGVDLSDAAIETARQLNDELELDAQFIRCNIYDLKEQLDEKFDIVFTSYGTIGWLPDLDRWAEIVAHFLQPGGEFHFIEFHPVVWMLDNDFTWLQYSYFNKQTIVEEIEGTYAERDAPIKNTSISWNHGLAEVISALLKNGLRLERFEEFDYSPYNCFNKTVQIAERKWQIEGLEGKIPMVFALKAIRT